MFTTYLLPQIPNKGKISIIHADPLEYLANLEDGVFDFCHAELWNGIPEIQIFQKTKNIGNNFKVMEIFYWLKDIFLNSLSHCNLKLIAIALMQDRPVSKLQVCPKGHANDCLSVAYELTKNTVIATTNDLSKLTNLKAHSDLFNVEEDIPEISNRLNSNFVGLTAQGISRVLSIIKCRGSIITGSIMGQEMYKEMSNIIVSNNQFSKDLDMLKSTLISLRYGIMSHELYQTLEQYPCFLGLAKTSQVSIFDEIRVIALEAVTTSGYSNISEANLIFVSTIANEIFKRQLDINSFPPYLPASKSVIEYISHYIVMLRETLQYDLENWLDENNSYE